MSLPFPLRHQVGEPGGRIFAAQDGTKTFYLRKMLALSPLTGFAYMPSTLAQVTSALAILRRRSAVVGGVGDTLWVTPARWAEPRGGCGRMVANVAVITELAGTSPAQARGHIAGEDAVSVFLGRFVGHRSRFRRRGDGA